MQFRHHALLVTAASVSMALILYSSKPRNYAPLEFIVRFLFNTAVWIAIFGIIYALLYLLIAYCGKQ